MGVGLGDELEIIFIIYIEGIGSANLRSLNKNISQSSKVLKRAVKIRIEADTFGWADSPYKVTVTISWLDFLQWLFLHDVNLPVNLPNKSIVEIHF